LTPEKRRLRGNMSDFAARILHIATPRDAERELVRIKVDPAGIALMTGKMQTRCVKLEGLLCRQANILKQEMLSLGGDAAVARGSVACSIERTDVILIGTDKQLLRLCGKLGGQPFGLPALGPQLRTLLTNSNHPAGFWDIARQRLPLHRPLIMGILNVTPDSFSDGNRYFDPQQAVDRALEMVAEGADIIDIGGESTRPGAAEVPPEEERARVVPVITALRDQSLCPISVDTWKSSVAREALDAGAAIVNDISGFTFDPAMKEVVAASGAGAVLMHTRGTPRTMQRDTDYDDLIGEITASLRSLIHSAVDAGVARERIAVDPGIGFAKDRAGNIEILRRLDEFQSLGQPILVGTSRKSFIGTTLGRETGDRLYGTAATVALAVDRGARILRVHDVRAMRDVADMTAAISSGCDTPAA